MRVLMISANREDVDIRVPALGLACVAAAAERAGHHTQLLDLLTVPDPAAAVAQAVAEVRPNVIGLSVRNIDDQRMQNTRFLLDQAKDAVAWCRKATSVPIVLGGAGFSILPQPILEYLDADAGVQGEGEAIFPQLLARLEAGADLENMPGVYRKGKPGPSRRTYVKDLDSFPLPDPSLVARSLSGSENAPVPVQSRRGCPLSCSYCSTPTIEGTAVRWRSPESVAAWIGRWADQGFRSFYFVDNTFNLPPSYARRLCSKIIDSGLEISWRCILFPGGLDEGLIRMLAAAGCREVSLGFESGSASILGAMKKPFDAADVRRAAGLLRRHGIRSMGFLMLGGPGETRETAEETLAFAESLELDSVKVSVGIRIYPDTDVARAAEREGIICSEQDLLFPKFYICEDLKDWLCQTVAERVSTRANWIF